MAASRSASGSVVLTARDLEVRYPARGGDVVAVRGLNLEIREHEIVGLVGETGSGKSTAAMALLGMARPPGRVASGQVLFQGADLLTMPEEELRQIRGRDIAMVVQNPRAALNPLLRVGKQISNVYRAHHAVDNREALNHAIRMLELVGINDPVRRVEAYAHELSGGMAQRTLIAMALSSRPKLLIADEPTSGLDVTIQAQLLDEMWETVQQTGSAVLLVSQDLGVIANYCDRVLVLHDGGVVEDSPVRTFFRSPRHEYSRSILAVQVQEKGRGTLSAVVTSSGDSGGEPVISVARLTTYFPVRGSDARVQAVYDVSFDIGQGETLGLVGESGSGKTTVGRCLLRLVEPTSGEIRFRGRSLASIPLKDFRGYRARMQIIFQDPFDSLNPKWSVGRTLREPLDLHTDLSPDDKRARVRELMGLVGLPSEVLGVRSSNLSSGRQQRVGIARAIATNPEFIVLDEPTSALAPRARREIIELLQRLQDELGLSYLFISHDLSTVRHISHRVAVMYLSQIVEIGPIEQIFSDPRHPYSKALLASVLLPDPDQRRIDREIRESLEGEIPSPINLPTGCYLYGRCPDAVDACAVSPQVLETLRDGREVRCWRVVEQDSAAEDAEGRVEHSI